MARTERQHIGGVEVRQYVIPLFGQRRRRPRQASPVLEENRTAAADAEPPLFDVEEQ